MPHQGKRHFFKRRQANPPAGWGGPAGAWSSRVPRRNPLLGERKQVRASVITNQSPFAPPSPIKAKTPAIKPHQGLSRQTMKKPNTTIPSANGAAPYQPKATPWVSPLGTPALKGRLIPPIKAKTPAITPHQALSSQPQKFPCRPASIPGIPPLRLRVFALMLRHQGTIKAKTPAIVPNQGKSRHPLKNECTPHSRAIPTRHAPLPPSLDVGRSMLDACPAVVGRSRIGCFGPVPHLCPSAFICGQNSFSRIWRLSRLSLPLFSPQNPFKIALIKVNQESNAQFVGNPAPSTRIASCMNILKPYPLCLSD